MHQIKLSATPLKARLPVGRDRGDVKLFVVFVFAKFLGLEEENL